jgi:conjugative transfer signal peptidase TraF
LSGAVTAKLDRRARRLGLGAFLATVALGVVLIAGPSDYIVYNESPSAPQGFYVRISGPARLGSFVTVRARDVARPYAALRGFVGPHDRFIKRVGAVAPERICAKGDIVTLGNRRIERLSQDRSGRALPRWSACRVLHPGEIFLLGDTPNSFDSRYFGVVSETRIEGVWRRLL